MLPQIIQHSYTRSTRDITTNFPTGLTDLYNSYTPRNLGKHSILPPLIPPSINHSLPTKFKKILHEKRIEKDLLQLRHKKVRIVKGKAVEMLWDNFNIYIRKKDIAENSVEEIMEKGYYIYKCRELEKGARKIQTAWKRYCFNKARQKLNKERNEAAVVIQRVWRRYARKRLYPRLKREKEGMAAIVIQRYYRGYRCRMRYSVLKGRIQIEKNNEYFDSVRKEIYEESARIIYKYWKKYQVSFI